jgi:capsular exopolysaccharide synthesis family protein
VDLAIMCAEAGQRVLVVDADLRRPAVAKTFGMEGVVGLTDVLVGDLSIKEVVQRRATDHELWVLPSGSTPANPTELLGSDRMQELVQELSETYELVIFDSPPVLPVADALVLAQALDGVVMVTRLESSRRDQLQRAVDTLRHLNLRLVGLACIGNLPDDETYAPLSSGGRAGGRRQKSHTQGTPIQTSAGAARHAG